MKICQLTTVHHRRDTRIFLKELPSLVSAGYDVNVIVADGKGSEDFKGYHIHDAGLSSGRLMRMFSATRKVYHLALRIEAEVYHFHDPELLPVGLKLRKMGKKVIYDVHEDVPRDIQSKYYLPSWLRGVVARLVEFYENRTAAKLTCVITATPYIFERFNKINRNTTVINNFPRSGELVHKEISARKDLAVCYIGDITVIRAAREMLRAVSMTRGFLHLAGNFENKSLESELLNTCDPEKLVNHGFVNRLKAAEIMARSMAGLVIFYPEPNHINAQPNKIFEYMSAGLPVIGSNFTLWKEIILGNGCGFCVDPQNPAEIAMAIDYIFNHPEEAKEMGHRGRKAVYEKYNWETEEKKLQSVYQILASV